MIKNSQCAYANFFPNRYLLSRGLFLRAFVYVVAVVKVKHEMPAYRVYTIVNKRRVRRGQNK